jgi:hypothetical protein
MSTPQVEYLSISATKCRDNDGWLNLVGRIHGTAQIYIPLTVNHGCSLIARPWVGRAVEVVVNNRFTFVTTLRLKKKTALTVSIPWRLRKILNGGVVSIKIRPIDEGDNHEPESP